MTDLYGIVVDAVCQWITPHSDVQVGVTQPLNSLLNVRHSPQGNLLKKVKTFIINNTLHFVGKMFNHLFMSHDVISKSNWKRQP